MLSCGILLGLATILIPLGRKLHLKFKTPICSLLLLNSKGNVPLCSEFVLTNKLNVSVIAS